MLWKLLCLREEGGEAKYSSKSSYVGQLCKSPEVPCGFIYQHDFSTEPKFKCEPKTFPTSELILHYFLYQQVSFLLKDLNGKKKNNSIS